MKHPLVRRAVLREDPATAVYVALMALAMNAGVLPALCSQADAADSGTRPVFSTEFAYTGELVVNASGGTQRGTRFAGAADVQLTLLLERLIGWRGATIFVFVLGTHGGAPSDLVGDVQGVSNLQAPSTVRLEEAWLQQNMLSDRLSLLVGRYDLNTEFYRFQSGALFVNSSFGMGPEFATSGVAGPSIYPSTAVGARVDFKPSPNTALRAAVLDGVPVDRPDGESRIFASGDGALLVGEVALLSRPATVRMPRNRRFRVGRTPPLPYAAKLALGGWYYTARFPDLADTLPNGDAVQHHGSGGVYLVGDVRVWAALPGQPGALTAFAQFGLGDARVNQIGAYLGGGLTFTAPIPARAEDELGLAVATALNGTHFERAQAALGLTTAAESAVELTYRAQLGSWIAAQPDLQYVIHPGGSPATRNALVPGVLIQLSY